MNEPLPQGESPAQPATPENQVVVEVAPAPKPFLIYVILVITVSIWLVQIATKNGFGMAWLGFNEAFDLPAALGMKINSLIRAGEWWRLFTPMLLHDDNAPIHLITNMYFLAVVGGRVEQYFGRIRFLALYILAGFAGNVVSFAFSPYLSWGASTALFGLLGAEAVFIWQNRGWLTDPNAALKNIGTILAINIGLGFFINADNWGHMGGLIGGAMFAWFGGPLFGVEQANVGRVRLTDERNSLKDIALAAALVALLFCSLAIFGMYFGVAGFEESL